MSVAISHRSTIAVTSWRNRRVIRPRCSCASATLCAILLRSVRRYDQRASAATMLFRHSHPLRFCHALGVLINSRPGSRALLKLGIALFCSRTNPVRFHSSFNRPSQLRKFAFKWLLYFQSVATLLSVSGYFTFSQWLLYFQSVATLLSVSGYFTFSQWLLYFQSVATLLSVSGFCTFSQWLLYFQSVASVLSVCGYFTFSQWLLYFQSVATLLSVSGYFTFSQWLLYFQSVSTLLSVSGYFTFSQWLLYFQSVATLLSVSVQPTLVKC